MSMETGSIEGRGRKPESQKASLDLYDPHFPIRKQVKQAPDCFRD